MAIKTVIGRLLKPDVNSSDDADLFGEGEDEDNTGIDVKAAAVSHEIATNANKKVMEIEESNSIPIPPIQHPEPAYADAPEFANDKTQGPGF
ncbi:MAG: hypothetical protein QM802_20060 [Agriterribacter sp.]